MHRCWRNCPTGCRAVGIATYSWNRPRRVDLDAQVRQGMFDGYILISPAAAGNGAS